MNHTARFITSLLWIVLSQYTFAEDYPLHSPVPADGATDVNLGIYVNCSGWTYGDLFEVRWSKNADMSGYRSKRVSNNPSTDLNGLEEGTTYFWRIYAYDNSTWDFEPKSPIWHFTTKGTPPAGDCDLSDVPTSSDYYAATYFLCERSVLNGSKEDGKTNVEGKLKRSHLAKIAFRGVYLLNGREMPAAVTSDYYPTVYGDIAVKTEENDYYYQAARALLYLEYGDGVSPFDRNRLNFVPDDDISRLHTLKVLMETFNIRPDLNGSDNPFPNDEKVVALAANDPIKMGYIRRAAALGIITTNNAEFRPYVDCKRGEAFVMLARIMQKVEAGEFDNPNPQTADYFEPLNTTLATISLGLGLQMGNFNHYTKTSFALNGVVPLAFAHTYNSYNTTLPSVFFGDKSKTEEDDSYQPLGDGWSHNYHSFITVVGDYQNNVEDNGLRVIVHWGGGGIHVYKSNGTKLVPESMGIYDEMIYDGGDELTIKSKTQVEYLFSKQGGSGAAVFYLTSITDRNGNTLTINYENGQNGSKRISSVSDGQRSLDFYYLSGTDLLSEVKDPLNRSIKFEYFDNNQTGKKQLKSFTDAEGNTTTYEYADLTKAGSSKLLSRIQLPKGNYIENEYDANCRLKNTVSGVSGVPATKTSVSVAAQYGSGTISTQSQIDVERGSLTSSYNYTYNENNVATSITGAEGMFVKGTYDNADFPERLTAIQSNNTNISDVSYDAKGNVTSMTIRGDGTLTTSMTYDDMNNITSVTDPEGNKTIYTYDGKGNLTNISAPEDVTIIVTVDEKGLPKTMANAMEVKTDFEYNRYGNLIKTTLPALGLSNTAEYDEASRLISTTDALGRISSFIYDRNDFLTSETDPIKHTTNYAYDVNGNLISITNAKGGVTSLSYDNATDWLTSVSFAGATKEYSYNSDGTLTAYTKPDGTRLENVYDQLGRITNDGVNSYTYDNKMHLSSVSDGSSTLTFNYDGFNRLSNVKYSGNGSNSVRYYYDNNNNVKEVDYPNGTEVLYTYDGLNRMKTVQWIIMCSDGSRKGGSGIVYTWRKDGQLSQVNYPNHMVTNYDYDEVGRLVGKKTTLADGTVVAGYDFVLDKVGNIIEQTATEPYQNKYEESATTDYSYDDGNRILKAGNLSFTYDANGNTTKRGNETYEWSKSDRLVVANGVKINYDPLGLIRSYGDTDFTISLLGDGNVISDSKSGYNYVYGMGLEARFSPDGDIDFYVTDMRGSVVAIVDDNGNITHKYQYDEFGNVTQKEEADYNPFQYVGKYGVMALDDHLYYMRARHYDPTIGRFLSEDPIWSTNLYPYADNNPIIMVDINGAAATPLETGRPGPNTPTGNTGGGGNNPLKKITDNAKRKIYCILIDGAQCKNDPPRSSPYNSGEWDRNHEQQQKEAEELIKNELMKMGATMAVIGGTVVYYTKDFAVYFAHNVEEGMTFAWEHKWWAVAAAATIVGVPAAAPYASTAVETASAWAASATSAMGTTLANIVGTYGLNGLMFAVY